MVGQVRTRWAILGMLGQVKSGDPKLGLVRSDFVRLGQVKPG